MLSPQDRTLLRDALRPPTGFTLDRAILTTFSLDLMTLLTVPVSFTVFHLKDEGGPLAADPLALLEALRRYARKMTVFCQAGQIYIPKQGQLLLSQLETSVFEVTSPRGGVFHPKLAILRYLPIDSDEHGGQTSVAYRILCSSRNLTFDRSWDTLLVLDGAVAQRRKSAYSRNQPLARFVRALPNMLLRMPSAGALDHMPIIADELLRADFNAPEGFDEFAFCPVGITGGGDWPILGYGRTVTVAPFIDDGFFKRLTAQPGEHQVISRIESLDELSLHILQKLSASWYMNPAADAPATLEEEQIASAETCTAPCVFDNSGSNPTDEAIAETSHGIKSLELTPTEQLSGLHAKFYVTEDKGRAHIWTGSANATIAAFERNVEFLVRLTGKRSWCGVDALLPSAKGAGEPAAKDRGTIFADLLVRYARKEALEIDRTRQILEHILDETRYMLAAAGIVVHVEPTLDSSSKTLYRASLTRTDATPIGWRASVTVACHPATLHPTAAIRLLPPLSENVARFEPLSFEALTSFFAFRVTAREKKAELSCGFVLNLPLRGAPTDREGRVLLSLIRNREQLLRYLRMLLADDDEATSRITEILGKELVGTAESGNGFGLPLLEPMLQALDRQPTRIDQIARLIDDLQQTPEGRELMNEEFLSVWEPIWEARKEARR